VDQSLPDYVNRRGGDRSLQRRFPIVDIRTDIEVRCSSVVFPSLQLAVVGTVTLAGWRQSVCPRYK